MVGRFARAAFAGGAPGCTALVLRYGGMDAGAARPLVWSVVRAILSISCGERVDGSSIRKDRHGKPMLGAPARVGFNVSHCASASLLAVSSAAETGCDVEDRLRPDDRERVGPLVLHAAEARFLDALATEPLRRAAFAKCWVRKEAALKACGFGFALDARSIDTAPASERPAVRFEGCNDFILHDAPQAIGLAAAVACTDPTCTWQSDDLAVVAALLAV